MDLLRLIAWGYAAGTVTQRGSKAPRAGAER
jgi:hypothetical protein